MELERLLAAQHDDHDDTPLQLIAPDRGANRARRRALTRRTFIGVSLGAAGAVGAVGVNALGTSPAYASDPDPFTLGVASGDPTATGIVLWTRLAVDPLAEDGSGGMPNKRFPVEWQLATDEKFSKVVQSGSVQADPAWGHSVHIEVEDLEPDQWYWYRFRSDKHLSPIGRTRTMPAADATTALHAVAVTCSHYEGGWFTGYDHAAQEGPDLVVELGDYIYEGGGVDGRTRVHPGSTCITLGDYRRRYALYKAEPETQQLHQAAPWIVTWDDHEVQDNWAGIHPKDGVPSDEFEARRTAATRAFYENMPLRRRSQPDGPSIQLYRRFRWGRTADLHVLDTRQYRDRQACHDGGKTWWFVDCPEQADPNRTMLGEQQTNWLLDGFDNAEATWQVMAQGVVFSRRQGPDRALGSDSWDGYQANRNLIRDAWTERGVNNAVVLTGDVHLHMSNEIKADFEDPDSQTVGVELVSTSITSGDDGRDSDPNWEKIMELNPHIKWIGGRRGYLSMDYTTERLEVRHMQVPYVSKPGAPVEVARSYEVPAGAPRLHPLIG